MDGTWFWLAPTILVLGLLGAFVIQWFESDWDVIRNTRVWQYEINRITKERRVIQVSDDVHQPIDTLWLKTGVWTQPDLKAASHVRAKPLISLSLVFLALSCLPALATSEYTATRLTWKRGYNPLSIVAHDGDTVNATLKGGVRKLRLYGIDTPELTVACQKVRGYAARDRLNALLSTGRVIVREAHQHDKYGRPLSQVVVGNVNLAQSLVSEGLAKPYTGGKRPAWC